MKNANRIERSSGPLLLLVQNNVSARVAIVKELLGLGYRVAVAKGVEEAREMIDDLNFIESGVDGLVVDYKLPDGTGCRIVQDFQRDHPDVPTALILEEDNIAVQLWSRAKDISLLRRHQLWSQLQPWLAQLKTAA